jgi:pimeloyl-ACP methyl ester carboxylesterase
MAVLSCIDDAMIAQSSLYYRRALLEREFPLHTVTCADQVFAYRERTLKVSPGETAQPLVVVALHGIGSGAASWLDVALTMQRGRFIAWDAPGYGRSTPLGVACPNARDYGQALAQFLAALEISHCLLVGHSLGALMAAGYLGSQTPKRVDQAIFISPARGYGEDPQRAQVIRSERMNTLQELGLGEMARLRSARLLSNAASETAREWVRWNMANLNESGYRQAIELLCGDDITRYAPSPVVSGVFCGSADVITPPDSCRAIATTFNAPFSLIADAGHASPVESPLGIAAFLQAESFTKEFVHV